MNYLLRDTTTDQLFTTTQLPPNLYPYGVMQLVFENATEEDIANYLKTKLARVLHQDRNRSSD